MPRKITGHTEWRGGRWQVQATTPEGAREWFDLPATIRQDQESIARAVGQGMAVKIRNGDSVPEEREETVSEWFGRWFAWRKERGQDEGRGQAEKYVLKAIGHLPMRDGCVTTDHIKRIVETLDELVRNEDISWKTAVNVFSQYLSKPFKDATNGKNPALCVLTTNPVIGVAPPDKGARTKKQYLYPNEAYRLLLCEAVPLWRRRIYAFAIYTYMRAGEIAALRWDDVDLERGIITVHQAINRNKKNAKTKATKTDEERRVIIEPALLPLLEAMLEEATTALVFPKLPPYHGCDGQAPTLRKDLETAGVKRAALITKVRTRKRMTFHDLRATGITWAAIRGDDALKIMARSGHTEYQTMMAYVREAEVMREGFGDVFPELPTGLLGIAHETPNRPRNTSKTPKNLRPQRDSNPC